MPEVLIHGCCGRMGRVLSSLIEKSEGLEVSAGVDRDAVQTDFQFPVFRSFADPGLKNIKPDVIVDFSNALAVESLVGYAVESNTPLVICTTGISSEMQDRIVSVSEKTAVFQSSNMSFGVSIVADILKKYSKVLYESGFDAEIIEKHHNQKVDAPSGTALLLADSVKKGIGSRMEYVCGRSDSREKRKKNEIGISSIRGGNIVGEHSVVFAGGSEVIEIKHEAFSREIFAAGAIKAALFICGKKTGLYGMNDLIDELNSESVKGVQRA